MESPVRNLIGKDTVIKGDVESSGDIRVDGKLIGSLKSNGKIVVGQTGIIEGDIICKQADISGSVKGILTCEELTTLKSTSRVEIDMNTKQLCIEVGAVFTGKCQMTQSPQSAHSPQK
ncbi:MAG: polymer-forming cytoskeletal protein [Bacteroidales bacterium]|nr:polymer-forming cytoskeletal protein [Bacteroidales bacterium]